MRSSFLILIFLCAAASTAFACSCGSRAHGKNDWNVAELEAQNSTLIFEGTLVHFELKWNLFSAKDGEMIPAEMFYGTDQPRMVVTFRVLQKYKGELGTEVALETGLGGSDCGAIYQPGLVYLLYAWGPTPDQLSVNMCSPGGWIGDTEVATDLRYLRQERPTPTDLAPILNWSQADFAKQEEKRARSYEETRKKFEAATGKICGKVANSGPSGDPRGTVAFLSTLGYSPVSLPEGVHEDGSFCSPDLGPGKYYVYFVRRSEHDSVALYYPGITDVARAAAVEVNAGQTRPDVAFKTGSHNSYSVRGFVFSNKKADFGHNGALGVTVALVRADGDRRVWYSEKASSVLPGLGYFKFENVVPGRYYAVVQTANSGWMTRKVEVEVTTHIKFVNLELLASRLKR
jgi:hypothetical protein